MLNIAIRADSSHIIGTGHIMRCLTLAHALKKRCHANIYFFTRKNKGNINNLIVNSGFNLVEMQVPVAVNNLPLEHSTWLGATQEQDALEFLQLSQTLAIDFFDYLIIDHYAIDKTWQKQVNQQTQKMLIIDDLGDRVHQCDYLLDQTYHCPAEKYTKLVPKQCVLMLGTKFALLRDEFKSVNNIHRSKTQNTILVMFGGADANNLTLKTLHLLHKRTDLNKINIILNSSALHIETVKTFIDSQTADHFQNIKLHINPANIALLMQKSSLAIGAAGTTSWERCASGLPSVVVIQAENQRQIALELQQLKVITCLEEVEMTVHLNKHIDQWIKNEENYQYAVQQATKICDGLGSERVVKKILVASINK